MNSVLNNKLVLTALDIVVPFGPLLRSVDGKEPFANWPRLFWQTLPTTFFWFWLCFTFIPFFGAVLYLLVLVPLSAYKHVHTSSIQTHNATEVYLWYITVVSIGFMSLWGFIGHTFMADSIAADIGWATGSPFQTELAFYTLGSSVAGLMAIWIRGSFLYAVIITKVIFWYGAAYTHMYHALTHDNFSPLNIGTPLVNDILLPSVLILLMLASFKVSDV